MKFAKKAKIKITFQKMKGTFLDSIPWLKILQPPLIYATSAFRSLSTPSPSPHPSGPSAFNPPSPHQTYNRHPESSLSAPPTQIKLNWI